MQSIEKLDLISNEDIEITVDRKIYQLCNDSYHALGWKTIGIKYGIATVRIILERKRQIINKAELCKLQLECEKELMELERMLKEKKLKTKRFIGISEIEVFSLLFGLYLFYKCNSTLGLMIVVMGIINLVSTICIFFITMHKLNEKHLADASKHYDIIYILSKKAEQLIC